MKRYILRLDDASPYFQSEKWIQMEQLLDKYKIYPIIGIIPDNKDPELIKGSQDGDFWHRALNWQKKGWSIALHGYDHVYVNCNCKGLNPVHKKSEFVGLSITRQEEKIEKGFEILKSHGLNPTVFFAPSHTFDENTLLALKNKTDISIISDTVASDVYYMKEFYFIPQQAGSVRRLPLKTLTFCYHPDNMNEAAFIKLEEFLKMYHGNFVSVLDIKLQKRKKDIFDKFLSWSYFTMRSLRDFRHKGE